MLLAALLLAPAGLLLVPAGIAQAQLTNEWMTSYTDYVAPGGSYAEVRASLDVVVDPSLQATPDAYKAMFWSLNGALTGGDALYIGIQHNPHFPAGQRKTVRFSIWNAVSATPAAGASCIPFGGEGIGQTCYKPYAWVEGRSYAFRVVRTAADVFEGQVQSGGGAWETIGTIHAKASAGDLFYMNWFTEYFGPGFPDCAAIPFSAVRVFAPTFGDGAATASHSADSVGMGNCNGFRSVVTEASAGSSTHLFNAMGPLDECALGIHDCDANAACTDTADAFTCACIGGYAGDGLSCASVFPGPDAGGAQDGGAPDGLVPGAPGSGPSGGVTTQSAGGCAVAHAERSGGDGGGGAAVLAFVAVTLGARSVRRRAARVAMR